MGWHSSVEDLDPRKHPRCSFDGLRTRLGDKAAFAAIAGWADALVPKFLKL